MRIRTLLTLAVAASVVAPALGNAIFDASGRRLRRLPFVVT